MKREFRDLWLKRCTDGTYRQGTHELAREGDPKTRCCLGVAHAVGQELNMIPTTVTPFRDDGSSRTYLSEVECEIIGLEESRQYEFARTNDGYVAKSGQYYPDEVLDLIKNYPVED